ncbi:MAG: hypothetical protein HY984_00355 [Candidatus Magasanikbacteria bacterium]|nr:hypothetical protein [Candidatus Magasanikbacteria bacterium]
MNMLSAIRAGTSGFRGVTNTEITPLHAFAIGALYVDWLWRNKGIYPPRLVVGYDNRFGAEMLADAVTAGIRAAGGNVLALGRVSTGVFSVVLACSDPPFDGGIQITGSHMPPERIGIIPMNGDATYCTDEVTDFITAGLAGFPGEDAYVPPQEIGDIRSLPTEAANLLYLATVKPKLGALETVGARQFRVLIDPGNGTVGEIARRLYGDVLDCEVGVMNLEPKPVPDRPSECRAASCAEAMSRTREGGYDLGLCFDGDGDRVLFIDADGHALSEDLVGAIFARATLESGDVCVTPINSSGLIEVVCAGVGARVEYCRIGQPDTGRAIKEHRAASAYEAAAKYAFPKGGFIWYDGVFAGARMLELMVKTGQSLRDLAMEFPPFFRVDRNIALPPHCRVAVVAGATRLAEHSFKSGAVRVDTLDGVRYTYPDRSWVLLRPSGTEPLARVYADAPNRSRAEALATAGEACFISAIAAEAGAI